MKRSKQVKVNKSYEDLLIPPREIEQKEVNDMVKLFLEFGGIIYQAKRGRRKDGLTKASIAEHNKEVSKKVQEYLREQKAKIDSLKAEEKKNEEPNK